jgi:hypothetical protein
MANEEKKGGGRISKDEFEKMQKRYDKKNPGKTRAVYFNKEVFKRILENKETDSIAIYFGEYDDDTNTVMAIGVDANMKLIYDSGENKGNPCPPYCS